mgnify:CR=1 FL=1
MPINVLEPVAGPAIKSHEITGFHVDPVNYLLTTEVSDLAADGSILNRRLVQSKLIGADGPRFALALHADLKAAVLRMLIEDGHCSGVIV